MKNTLLFFGLTVLLFACSEPQTSFEAQLEIDREKIEEYLEENNLTATYDEELQIYHNITEEGVGSTLNSANLVEIKYSEATLDGIVLQSTPDDATREFQLIGVPQGLQRALSQLRIGGKGTFYIPSGLGYGQFGNFTVGPNRNLIFEAELVNFR